MTDCYRRPASLLSALIFATVCAAVLLPQCAAAEGAGSSSSSLKASDLACGACRVVSRALHKALQRARANDFGARGSSTNAAALSKRRRALIGDLVTAVCQDLPAHAHMRHPVNTDRWGLAPLLREDGSPADLASLESQPGLANWLRMRCEELLDDREEEAVELLIPMLDDGVNNGVKQLEASLCGPKTSGTSASPAATSAYCTQELLSLEFQPPPDPVVSSGAKKLDLKFVSSGGKEL